MRYSKQRELVMQTVQNLCAVRVGRSFLLAIIPTAVLMALVEALSHFPVVGP